MSTIVCRHPSLPSMDSSHVVEATTMRLKLIFEPSSLVQSPSSHLPIDDYFHTETKNSCLPDQKSLKLSQKSLELCTESLGSETGSDTSEADAIFAFPASSLSVKKCRRDQDSKKVLSRSFPPPLTTMSRSKPFQVRPHREGGRLIIEATEISLGNSFLRAERSHGRLLLTCWKSEEDDNCDTGSDENDMNDVEEKMTRNVVVENFQRLRRCNGDEHRDKGICWEPSGGYIIDMFTPPNLYIFVPF